MEHLTENAKKFVDGYFVDGNYESDFNAAVAAIKYDASQDAFNSAWLLYDEVAPRISAAFQRFNNPPSAVKTTIAKILQFPSRKR